MTEEPLAVVPPRRQPWWLLVVLLVVAAGAGLGVGALIWAGDSEPAATPAPYPSGFIRLTPEQYDKCVREISVHFEGANPDQDMRSAADKLRDDPRFDSMRVRTQQESFEEFKKVFADQPEVVSQVRLESMPATVILTVRAGTTGKQQEKPLKDEFPGKTVSTQSTCPR